MKSIETSESGKKEQTDTQSNAASMYAKYQQLRFDPQSQEYQSKVVQQQLCTIEKGNARAQYELGKELAILDQSVDMAVYWLQKAAVQGVGEAFAELDELDAQGHQNVATRIEKAKLYTEAAPALQIAADAGDSAAAIEFAVCCQHGYGVEVDRVKAFQLYLQAAELGNHDAQYRLAQCYENGIGTAKNAQQAAELYYNLVKSEHAKTLSRLIPMYQNGLLGDPHSDAAIEVCMHGLEKRNADAMCELAELAEFAELGVAQRAARRFCSGCYA